MNLPAVLNNDDFFGVSNFDMVDGLIAQYNHLKLHIERLHQYTQGEGCSDALHYFLNGNNDDGRYTTLTVERLFQLEGAIAALNSAFWSKVMLASSLMNYMPQKRRDEWNELIRAKKCPNFEDSTVRATLDDLLGKRHQFLAERVDGIFRGLSGEHVTNNPAAFGKRMIVANVIQGEWNFTNSRTTGLINDLRCVIAKFMGREEPGYTATDGLINQMMRMWGEWLIVDGGAIKIRLYKKGTAHMEIHPDMAWRINSILAYLYPAAIPAEFRQKPKRKPKGIELIQTPLPFAVLACLESAKEYTKITPNENNFRDRFNYEKLPNTIEFTVKDYHASRHAESILLSIGGVKMDKYFQFEYDPLPVIGEICASGLVPEDKSHQYYPTPKEIAEYCSELLNAAKTDLVLEPSAGIGALADAVDAKVTCIEVSALRCDILKAKGHTVECADFTKWIEGKPHGKYDKVIMNPPFDRGQWKLHVEYASLILKKGGRLVAILPESANNNFYLNGFNCQYPKTFKNGFDNTGVTVCVLIADKV